MKEKDTKKKKFKVGVLLSFVLFMIIGGACGFFIMDYIAETFSADIPLWQVVLIVGALILVMYLIMMVHIVIHEGGHMIFGLLTGYKLCSFRVGSFMWIKKDGKIVLKRFALAGTGGQCLMEPPEIKGERFPVILYNMGGCIMNLIAVALFGVIFLFTNGAPLLRLMCVMMMVVGIGFALTNGIPIKSALVNNDGSNTLELGKSAKSRKAFWIQMTIAASIAKEIRLRDMPSEWFFRPTGEDLDNTLITTIGVFLANRLMDEHNYKEARDYISNLLSDNVTLVEFYRKTLVCDEMCASLILGEEPKFITEFQSKGQKKFMKQMKNYPSVLRTEYIYALIKENNEEKAKGIAILFEKISKNYPYENEIKGEREIMEDALKAGSLVNK